MKKKYSSKLLCMVLVSVLSFSLLPMNTYAANVPAFIIDPVWKALKAANVEITINDIKFKGTVENEALTYEKVEEIIAEAMAQERLDEQAIQKLIDQIYKMREVQGFSDKDMKTISNNVATTVGMLGGLPGAVASALQTLYNLIFDNVGAAAESAAGGGQGRGGTAIQWVLTGNMLGDEWNKSMKLPKQIRDGLEATRKLRLFYCLVDVKIEDFCNKNKNRNIVNFRNASPWEKFFTLAGVQCTERWTLNLRLDYKQVINASPNLEGGVFVGVYEGDYYIDIEYDLSNLEDNLQNLILSKDWPFLSMFIDDNKNFDIETELTDPGVLIVRRTLKGTARARVEYPEGVIFPSQSSDEITNTGAPTMVEIFYNPKDEDHITDSYEFSVSMDKKGLKIICLEDGKAYTMPFDNSMLRRGDNAGKDWKLKILPPK